MPTNSSYGNREPSRHSIADIRTDSTKPCMELCSCVAVTIPLKRAQKGSCHIHSTALESMPTKRPMCTFGLKNIYSTTNPTASSIKSLSFLINVCFHNLPSHLEYALSLTWCLVSVWQRTMTIDFSQDLKTTYLNKTKMS